MKALKLFAAGLRAWSEKRRYGSMVKEMAVSKTTQNVMMAHGGLGGALLAGIMFARSMWPSSIPWGEGLDQVILVAVVAVLGPVVSRIVALRRDPDKGERTATMKTLAEALSTVQPEVLADAARAASEAVQYKERRTQKPEADPALRAEKWAALRAVLDEAVAAKKAEKAEGQ